MNGVNIALLLAHLAKNSDDEQIRLLLDRMYTLLDRAPQHDEDFIEVEAGPDGTRRLCGMMDYLREFELAQQWERELHSRHHALSIADGIISAKVSNIQLRTGIEPGTLTIRPWLHFRALVDVIWWHVLEAVSSSVSLKACRECGTVFLSTRSNQNYCPARPEVKESPCAARHRMRRARANKKNRTRK